MSLVKGNFVRWFSVAMAILLLFSYGWTGSGNAQASTESKSIVTRSPIKTKRIQSMNKIDQDLKQSFKKHDQVTFLLKFKDQVDTKKVAQKAVSKKQMKTMTTAKVNLMKRSAIVSSLRNKANETQYTVKGFLKKQKKMGNVKEFHSFFIVNMMAVTGTKKVAEKLSKMNEIKKVLPNRTRHIMKQPDQDMSAVNKATKKVKTQAETSDGDIGENIQHIGAPEAWNQGIDGTGVVVGSIDTGVQWDHPALKEKYRGYDPDHPDDPDNEMNWFDAIQGKDSPYDEMGHGTHTMGTMVGSEPDGSNQIGVAPGAQWISAKAFSGLGGKDKNLLKAGEWMLAPKDAEGNPHPEMAPDVINNSWGSGAGKDEFYREMVQNWREAGIFPAFAAGNVDNANPGGPGTVAAPGNYPESFAVGATNNEDKLASFSLQGPSPYGEIKPEVTAPGVHIRSSLPGNEYGKKDGTSMATPAVSGTVALLKQVDSSLSVDELEQILMDTAIPLTDGDFLDSPNNGYGHGGLQAGNAVDSITSGLGTIRGKVRKEGKDNQPPEYKHEATKVAYLGMDLPLTINAKDNISITKVELEYRSSSHDKWKTIEAKRVDGDYKDGTYKATIPKGDLTEPSLKYKWHISDYGGNDVATNPYDVVVKEGITTGYFEDFETKPDGWTSYGENNSWEWGKPVDGPVPKAGPGNAFSGEKVYGTNLKGDYDPNSDMTLMMPPISMPDKGNVYLQFKQYYNFEDDWDYGYVLVSTDRENWKRLDEVTAVSDGWQDGEWEDGQVDLSDYKGEQIYVAFNVTSDSVLNYPGWYIDDVTLTDESERKDNKAHLPILKKHIKRTNRFGKTLQSQNTLIKKMKEPVFKRVNSDPSKSVHKPMPSGKKTSKPSKTNHNKLNSLPLNATISVEETGTSVRTKPADASYLLKQPSGTYTLKAEAYGFQSKSQKVKVNNNETSTADFTLQEIPKGTLEGTVTNKQTGDPIKGAIVSLTEDAAIKPVQTDKNGHYSLKGYEGDYTVHVSAPDYHSKNMKVSINGDEVTTQDAQLKPFIGYPEEIGYDDGTAENASELYNAGDGFAVHMSLPKDKDRAMVTGGKFKFWNDTFPDPGGEEFQVEIWDANGKGGSPGKKIAGPVDATAIRDDSQWTKVNLEDLGVSVDSDFYMVYIQTKNDPNAPALATDEGSPNTKRSWQYVDGEWQKASSDEGDYMIRALVDYEVPTPVITSPKDGSFTSHHTVTVKGHSAPNVSMIISNNGKKAATTTTNQDGDFSTKVNISNGKNKLNATAINEDGEKTDPSDPVVVIPDDKKPDLNITSPEMGLKTNKTSIKVEGTVHDEHLSWLKVNGNKANIDENGAYSKRILLEKGENKIQVVAQDKAGNRTTKTTTLFVNSDAPKIKNLKPDEDKHLEAGQTLKVEMDSDKGLYATFSIGTPQPNGIASLVTTSNDVLEMKETTDGHYVGKWTIPEDIFIDDAEIKITVQDDYGNTIRKTAKGHLYIQSHHE